MEQHLRYVPGLGMIKRVGNDPLQYHYDLLRYFEVNGHEDLRKQYRVR